MRFDGRLLTIAGLVFSLTAQARLYNYQDIFVGERAFGMGSASMAVGGDTGVIYYNPAALALDERAQVTASVSTYARIDTRTGEYVSLFKSASDNVSRGGFFAVPSTVGGHLRTGQWTWGGALLVPSSFENVGTLDIDANTVGSFEGKTGSLWVGAFVARKITDTHSLGLSFFYVNVSSTEKFLYSTTAAGNTSMSYVEQVAASSGIIAQLGGFWEISPRVNLGYSLRLPPIKLGGQGHYDRLETGSTAPDRRSFDVGFMPVPMRASIGIAWQPNPKLLLAADLHFYSAIFGNLDPGGNQVFEVAAKETLNFAMGAEYLAWDWLGVRAGFFTNMSSAAKVPKALSSLNDKVHMFGGTMAFVFRKETGSLSLGAYAQGGQGSSVSLKPGDTATVPRSNYLYGLVVGSSYRF